MRGRVVISAGGTHITVAKTGIERWLYNLSRNEPLLYGLLSVALALAAGWLAAAAFGWGGGERAPTGPCAPRPAAQRRPRVGCRSEIGLEAAERRRLGRASA